MLGVRRLTIDVGLCIGGALTLLTAGIPPYPLVRIAMVVGAIALFGAAWRRIKNDRQAPPRVVLEMPVSGSLMIVNEGGRVDSVTIADITVENRYAVTFPRAHDVRDRVEVRPTIRAIGLTAITENHAEEDRTLLDFLRRMARDKAMDIQHVRSDGIHSNSAVTDALVKKGMTPLRFPLVITATLGRQIWTRKETLMFDSSTDTAWISHPDPPAD